MPRPAETRQETQDCLAAAARAHAAESADPGFSAASPQLGGGRRSHAGADVRGTGSGGETHPGATTGRTVTGSCRPAMADWAAFCAASWHQKARDEFVGWSADARVANLELMVNNHRFLLLPGVRVRELASCVLNLAATRLPGDWEATYGVRPAYTYVSPDQCLLSCGRVGALRQADVRAAAGRRGEGRCKVGEAAGRRLEGTAAPGAGRSVSPRRRCRPTIGGNTGAERADAPGAAWWGARGKRVPANRCRCPDKEEAAYRLLSNPRVRHVIPQGMHGAAAGSASAGHDDAELQRAPRLVPLGGGGSGTKGIAAHFGLATARRPLGVFEATMRGNKDESESVRWPLRQGAGNRARLSRHAGRDRVRPGRRRNCCRSRRAPASWCAPAGGGACCAKTTAKKVFGTAEQSTLARRSLNLAACGGKRVRKKREVTIRAARVRLVPPGDR